MGPESQVNYQESKRSSAHYSCAMQRYLKEPLVDGGTVFLRQTMLGQSPGRQKIPGQSPTHLLQKYQGTVFEGSRQCHKPLGVGEDESKR